jgi:hypothetical protein
MHEITVNLHMHTRYSDGSGLHKDIATAAIRQGLDAVIVTDHNVLVKEFEGYHRDGNKRVLMLIGQEVHDQVRTATSPRWPKIHRRSSTPFATRAASASWPIRTNLLRRSSTRPPSHGRIGTCRVFRASNCGTTSAR